MHIDLPVVWAAIIFFSVFMYVVLDGFDLGAGIVHLLVARTDAERQQVIRSIGPVWDGNEVWLLAGGGTLYFAFPGLYASSFSGFYLPLMIVLWLLILRGLSIEFRSHIDSPTWKPLWDVVFFGASAVLAIFFGAALGNVVRGVPLDKAGDFFLPLWTNFDVQADAGILDWYTIPTGLFAFLTLTLHGALWVVYKTEGDVRKRALGLVKPAWIGVAALTVIVTILTFQIQPQVPANFAAHPWGYVFPALALLGLGGVALSGFGRIELRAFLASCTFIVGMLTSAAFGVFPYVLPSIGANNSNGLTVYNSHAAEYGLRVGLAWWIPGMILAGIYTVYVYRNMRGKVALDGPAH